MTLYTVSAPRAEPLHRTEAKAYLRVTTTDEDALVDSLIVAARQTVELRTHRALIARTMDWKLDAFPRSSGEALEVPLPPLVSVSSITYVDSNGDTQTWAASKYRVLAPYDEHAPPGLIEPTYAEVWPTTRQQREAVTVRFICGYAAPFTSTVANPGVLTPTPQMFADGDVLRVDNSGGAAPTGLTALLTDYYAVQSGATTLQLAATLAGSGVNVTGAGSGTHYLGRVPVPQAIKDAMLLLIGHWFDHREAVNIGNISTELPLTVDTLLGPFGVTRF